MPLGNKKRLFVQIWVSC